MDSREQRPLKFKTDHIVTEVVVEKLCVGDYGVRYLDHSMCPVYFERKSLGDLFSTMTSGYKRFKREMVRAKENGVKLVLAIEGTFGDVMEGVTHSRVTGETIIRKLMTLWLKYDLMPMFFESRVSMARGIREFYEAFGRLYK